MFASFVLVCCCLLVVIFVIYLINIVVCTVLHVFGFFFVVLFVSLCRHGHCLIMVLWNLFAVVSVELYVLVTMLGLEPTCCEPELARV